MEPILVLISNKAGELPREGLGMFSELYQGFFECIDLSDISENSIITCCQVNT